MPLAYDLKISYKKGRRFEDENAVIVKIQTEISDDPWDGKK